LEVANRRSNPRQLRLLHHVIPTTQRQLEITTV
jgi:hypothetical protein